MGLPPRIIFPREDGRPRATPSSDNPVSGMLFLEETQQECHICILMNDSSYLIEGLIKYTIIQHAKASSLVLLDTLLYDFVSVNKTNYSH